MYERWKWNLEDIEAMEWVDFLQHADVVNEINKQEAAAYKKAARGR